MKRPDWRKEKCPCGRQRTMRLQITMYDCGDMACWDRNLAKFGWQRIPEPANDTAPEVTK